MNRKQAFCQAPHAVAAALSLLLFTPSLAMAQANGNAASSGQIAPLLDGLGDLHHPITTKSERAQMFFDQGLRLTYAFNHAEAIRSFQEAQRLDPECAMAYWGEALALGPNLNQPMQPENIALCYAAIQKAISLSAKASEAERALISALATRYAPDASGDRAALDQAYAAACGEVAAKFPADDEALTLHADALMNTMPWAYYTRDGISRPNTDVILDRLETVIARNPKHIGALHLYIHATEEHYPHKAEQAADLLLPLTPTAGHLVHMPSHTYMRLGRYADAFESNRRAVEADEAYYTACRMQGIYPLAYYPHNVHFIMYAAERQGRPDMAIYQARKIAKQAHDHHSGMAFALYESFSATPLLMMVRFGRWEEILAEPVPPEDIPYVRGTWHFARALALTHTGDTRGAAQEIRTLKSFTENANFGGMTVGFADPRLLLTIATHVAEGELAAMRGKYDAAIASLDRAVRLEDGLMYNEPPDWPIPTRHYLGAALLDAGRTDEAEIVYWADLKKNPKNGYALFGLWQTFEAADGREADAEAIKVRFDEAWKDADHTLTSSRF